MNRRFLTAAAAAIVVALPTTAFFVAPTARADDSPGANLAGINVSATAQAALFEPLTPGLVGAGNLAQGNLFEVAVPYASSSTSTGPSSSGVAAPVYPGPTAAQLGTVLSTFQPLPAQLQSALNDPALAQSDYPAQVGVGSSSAYAPPGGAAAGVGTASSNATEGGVTSSSATSDTSLPGVLEIGSSTATATTQVQASSVQASSHTDVGTIKLLGGLVTISGLSSDATATSDGNNGQPSSDLKIGSVTVAGQAASIGPNGLQLSSGSQLGTLVPVLNQVLTALDQAGLSIRTISPTVTTDGTSADVTSGAVQISFVDPHIPNPNGMVPLSSVGFNLDLGLSQASADATALPPIPPFDSGSGSATSSAASGSSAPSAPSGTGGPSAAVTAGAVSPSAVSTSPGGTGGSAATGPTLGSPPSQSPARTGQGGSQAGPAAIEPAGFLGLPVKVAWVVIACLLSLVAAGPLLAYANWQLLRGRKA